MEKGQIINLIVHIFIMILIIIDGIGLYFIYFHKKKDDDD
jgi:uncharacterized protein YybS (DUF2232 family)